MSTSHPPAASIRQIALLALDAFGGKISGKTLFQKRLYFISQLAGWDLGFDAHFYGPYSDEVAGAVMALKDLGFVHEECQPFGVVNAQGFDVMRYDYKVSDRGREALEWLKTHLREDAQVMEMNAKRIKEAGNLNYVDLSIAAKAHFILKKAGKPMTNSEIAQAAKNFSWKVVDAQVKKAVSFLENLGMVKTVKQP